MGFCLGHLNSQKRGGRKGQPVINSSLAFEMKYFSTLELVQTFAKELVRSRRCNYSEDPLTDYLESHPKTQHHALSIPNHKGDLLNASLFRIVTRQEKPCIVYLHALGSNRLEALYILEEALERYDVVCFDFAGSGKSEGVYTTFGIWEQRDIDTVVKFISDKYSYESFVLWGRSMGAVSAALYLSNYPNKTVRSLVLDSPFSSFEKAALELACCKSSLPEFMLSACLIPLKKCIKENYTVDPFQIDLIPHMSKIHCKICLIYSQNDKVVHHSSSERIGEACPRYPHVIKIQEDHNIPRKAETYQQVLSFIRDSLFTADRRTKSRGISLSQLKQEKNPRMNTQTNRSTKPSSSKRKIFPINTEFDLSPNTKRRKRVPTVFSSFQSEVLPNKENKQENKQEGRQQGRQQARQQVRQQGRNQNTLINRMNNPIRKNRFLFK